MFHVFGDIKSLLKLETIAIDNNVFRLHYKLTVILLIVFSMLVNTRQYFGDPIDCVSNSETSHVMDNYCWIHSYIEVTVKREVGPVWNSYNPSITSVDNSEKTEKIYQKHYQWIGFVLFIQAIFFFLPRYLWRYVWEQGRVKGLLGGLNSPIQERENECASRQQFVADYLSKNLGTHKSYALKFFICELLTLVNLIVQMVLMNYFLNYRYTHLGLEIFKYNTSGMDAKDLIFPKLTSCEFEYQGSGGPSKYNSRCVLPVNVFNEKIYIFLWFYFIMLLGITAIGMIYRLLTILSPTFRGYVLQRRARGVCTSNLSQVLQLCDVGDWFLIGQIGKNVPPRVFDRILSAFLDKLEHNGAVNNSLEMHQTPSIRNDQYDYDAKVV